MTEHEQLARLCEHLGATRPQAETMARQLMKRADQIAGERSVSREAALKGLLDVVIKGRAGEVPREFQSAPPRDSKPSDEARSGMK